MIFNMQGVPLDIVLMDLGLRLFERKANPPPKRPRAQKYTGALLRAIRRARGVGRPIKSAAVWIDEAPQVFSSAVLSDPGSWSVDMDHAHIETRPAEEFFGIEPADPLATGPTMADAVRYHGSQRKAAAALGISLGKLQRGLRKAA